VTLADSVLQGEELVEEPVAAQGESSRAEESSARKATREVADGEGLKRPG
jgi:hypothetical protein